MTDQPASPSDDKRNIVLTGFMGTGKTTVGRILARKLRRGFLDTDAIIEQRHGAITEIFATQGEAAFRAMERGVAAELSTQKGLVIATGGRLLLDPVNISALSSTGWIYGLSATVGQVYSRVNQGSGAAKRPLLAGPDPLGAITSLLGERAPRYRRFPQVAAGTRRADTVASEIIELHDRAPTVLHSPNGHRAFIGINLLSRVRELLGVGAFVSTMSDGDQDQYGPFLSGQESGPTPTTITPTTITPTTVPPTTVLTLGTAELAATTVGVGDVSPVHVPTDWDGLHTTAQAGLPLIVDLATLQPPHPEHRELNSLWDRAVAELATAGWRQT